MINDLSEWEEMEQLFFELASENRLIILRLLQDESLRMQEVAQRLDVTATEAFRQLQRLSDVSLVERQSDGSYMITLYGRLALHLSASYEFISRHKAYFLNHDVRGLPTQFIDRIGELSGATLIMDSAESINSSVRIFLEADQYAYGVSERGSGPNHVDPLIENQVLKGVHFKLIVPEEQLSSALSQTDDKNIEVRGFTEPPVVIAMSEKEAAVCFRFTGGRIDYAGFFGKNQLFLNWTRDLFLHYWVKAKRL